VTRAVGGLVVIGVVVGHVAHGHEAGVVVVMWVVLVAREVGVGGLSGLHALVGAGGLGLRRHVGDVVHVGHDG